MRRHAKCLWRWLVVMSVAGVHNLGPCQATVTRNSNGDIDLRADTLDDDDIDLGDYLADLVGGL